MAKDLGLPDNFPPLPNSRCHTCRFWIETDSIDMKEGVLFCGYCHRYPPRAFMTGDPTDDYDLATGEWPVTTHIDWCGEWVEEIA